MSSIRKLSQIEVTAFHELNGTNPFSWKGFRSQRDTSDQRFPTCLFLPPFFLFRFPPHRGTVIQIGPEQIAEKIALNLNSIELNLQINLRRIFARTAFLAKISQNPAVDG